MHEAPCVDPGIVHMINNLESVSPMAIILAKTLNGLDSVHRRQHSLRGVPFFFRYDP